MTLIAAAAYDNSNTVPGSIFISTNAGASWLPTSAPLDHWYSVAASADGTKLIAGGTGLFTSTNSGATWTSNNIAWDFQFAVPMWLSVGCSANGATLVGIRDLSLYYANGGPRSYVSTNYGASWAAIELPRVSGRRYVASSADGNRLMVSLNYLYLSDDSGTTWTQQTTPGYEWGCVALSADGETMYLAIGADGYGNPGPLYKSQASPQPRLSLALSGSSLGVSWLVPSADFSLQASSDMANWSEVRAAQALNYTNLHYELRTPTSTNSTFYRLAHQ